MPQPGRGERLYLIDWEYASMSEPAWDLANLAGEAGFDAADRAGLLADYGAPPDGRSGGRASSSGRVLVLIPDGTRTMPMPLMFDLLQEEIGTRAAACDYLVALGTHPLMTDAQLSRLVGHPVLHEACGNTRVFNHRWDLPGTFAEIGTIPADEVAGVSGGLLSEPIPVKINRALLDYDQVVICGPVFPHEVVGFSGGNKYLFPGVSTGEMIDYTHWLGALLGSYNLMGTACTPVRELINRAAAKIAVPISCFALVVTTEGYVGCVCDPVDEGPVRR